MTLHLAGDAPPAEKTRATIITNQTMSEQSLAVVDAYYQAGLQGRLTDFAPYLHSDFSTTAPSYLPWGGLHAGAAFFRDEVLPNLPDVLDFGCFSYDVFHALPPRQCAGICRAPTEQLRRHLAPLWRSAQWAAWAKSCSTATANGSGELHHWHCAAGRRWLDCNRRPTDRIDGHVPRLTSLLRLAPGATG
jgi:hypothetical protein